MALPNILKKHKLLTIAGIGVAVICVILIYTLLFPKKPVAASPPPAEVEVVEVEQKDVPVYSEWIGTTDGMVNAEIRPQVTGYLLNKNYTEGTFVKKGQLLFEIDRRPFQAAFDQSKGRLAEAEGSFGQAVSQLTQAQAQIGQQQAAVSQQQAMVVQMQAQVGQQRAQLAQAEANQRRTQLDVNKYEPLRAQKAVTQQELDNAVQTNGAAQADIKAANALIESAQAQVGAAKAGVQTAQAQVRAAQAQGGIAESVIDSARAAIKTAQADVRTAQINLSLTNIIAPVDGIAGIALAQIGNLVSPTSGVLTTVSTVDPIKVYFTISEQEYLANTKNNAGRAGLNPAANQSELELILADDTTYPHPGRFFAADREVDERTGTIRIAGIFSNPGNTLRPGQYGRVRAVTSFTENALLVPQRSVTELQGKFQVAVVGAENKVEIRTVKVGKLVGSQQMIDEGLKAGEKVIVAGVQKAKPGEVVAPKPFVPPGTVAQK